MVGEAVDQEGGQEIRRDHDRQVREEDKGEDSEGVVDPDDRDGDQGQEVVGFRR